MGDKYGCPVWRKLDPDAVCPIWVGFTHSGSPTPVIQRPPHRPLCGKANVSQLALSYVAASQYLLCCPQLVSSHARPARDNRMNQVQGLVGDHDIALLEVRNVCRPGAGDHDRLRPRGNRSRFKAGRGDQSKCMADSAGSG